MIFATVDKDWNEICFVMFLIAHYCIFWMFRRDAFVKNWLNRKEIKVRINRFEFSDRMSLIETIHLLSKTNSAKWMNNIVTFHFRRETWLDALKMSNDQCTQYSLDMSQNDIQKVNNDTKWIKEAMKFVKKNKFFTIVKNQARFMNEEVSTETMNEKAQSESTNEKKFSKSDSNVWNEQLDSKWIISKNCKSSSEMIFVFIYQ